jgi:hypothetical protein
MATNFSTFLTMTRDRVYAREVTIGRAPQLFAFDEAIA